MTTPHDTPLICPVLIGRDRVLASLQTLVAQTRGAPGGSPSSPGKRALASPGSSRN